MAKKNNLHTDQLIRRFQNKSRRLMGRLGNNSKNFYQVDNWEAQGFIDGSVKKWKPVKDKPPGQKILVRTGRLRRSARSKVVRSNRAQVEFSAPYASYVNEERQFIGNSKTLDKENEKIIVKFMDEIFNVTLK